ncbi:MAG: AMP-binding protein [Acidimicrobiia bacterium]
MGGLLRRAAARYPERTALVAPSPHSEGGRRRWSYAQLLEQAEQVARSLLARFDPGERVAVWAPGIPEWVLLDLGTALAGIVLVTVNPAYRASELRYVLSQSRAAGIFLVPEFRSPMAAFLADIRPELPELREAVLFSEWTDFLASGDKDQDLPRVEAGDPVQIQYTSGTTGFPKGALLQHRGLTNNATHFARRLQMGPDDVYVNPMPLFHTGGCVLGVLGPLAVGATQVHLPAFDPALMLQLLDEERATVALGVPTMLLALLEHPDLPGRNLEALRVLLSGGSRVPADLVRRIESELGVRLTIVYGTTECSPIVTQVCLDDEAADREDTLGRPVAQAEVKIIDPVSGEIVPPGAEGELCVRGYLVMSGYFEMPEATAQAIDADDWYHTGDLASMDERGFCRIEGRLKDMIIRGGENIYPKEIEDLLFSHPGVADVAVVGVPDERFGEAVAAFIRSVPGSEPTKAELFALCREHLAPQKTPVHWTFLDSFPLTPSGKIQKFVLREQFVNSAVPG